MDASLGPRDRAHSRPPLLLCMALRVPERTADTPRPPRQATALEDPGALNCRGGRGTGTPLPPRRSCAPEAQTPSTAAPRAPQPHAHVTAAAGAAAGRRRRPWVRALPRRRCSRHFKLGTAARGAGLPRTRTSPFAPRVLRGARPPPLLPAPGRPARRPAPPGPRLSPRPLLCAPRCPGLPARTEHLTHCLCGPRCLTRGGALVIRRPRCLVHGRARLSHLRTHLPCPTPHPRASTPPRCRGPAACARRAPLGPTPAAAPASAVSTHTQHGTTQPSSCRFIRHLPHPAPVPGIGHPPTPPSPALPRGVCRSHLERTHARAQPRPPVRAHTHTRLTHTPPPPPATAFAPLWHEPPTAIASLTHTRAHHHHHHHN